MKRYLALGMALFASINAYPLEPPKDTASEPATVEAVVKKAKSVMLTCEVAFEIQGISDAVRYKRLLAEAENGLLREAIDQGKDRAPLDIHERSRAIAERKMMEQEGKRLDTGCSDRQAVIQHANRTIKKSKPALAGKIKDMVAQWLTAMDAMGKRNFADEKSKFETIANRLLLE